MTIIPPIRSNNPIIIPSLNNKNIRAIFTTKHGDPKQEGTLKEFVYKNSNKPDLILKRLQSEYPLNQVHGNSVYKYHDWFIGRHGDGMFTNKKFLPCIVNVADCVPILINSNDGTEVCAVHAGWRGLKKGIISKALEMFTDTNEKLSAWIGPSISVKQYEVGPSLLDNFSELNQDYKSCLLYRQNKYFCNLQMLAEIQLLKTKIINIKTVRRCVFEEAESFYSHRRDKPKERMSAIIWIE